MFTAPNASLGPADIASPDKQLNCPAEIELTAAFDGVLTRYEVELRAEGLARVHYVIAVQHLVAEIDEAGLDAKLDALVRGWDEALETVLVDAVGPARAARLTLS